MAATKTQRVVCIKRLTMVSYYNTYTKVIVNAGTKTIKNLTDVKFLTMFFAKSQHQWFGQILILRF
jgi:hypothetical protein